MIGAVLPVVAGVAETTSAEGGEELAPPWVLGLSAFVILVLLLFVVTRFNRDR